MAFGDGSTSLFFRDPDLNVIELSQSLKDEPLKSELLQEET